MLSLTFQPFYTVKKFMIPRILELKNFLSYPEAVQRVDFTPYNLICLSGKNGNGKSALLDAITWALWGHARKVSGTVKADEGLVRLGATRMMVSLEFSFASRIYRVRREFAKTYGKPYAALDFEIFNEQEDRFFSLTDKTIRATQAGIDKLLGLDYETFINSAFLRQGGANEFSKKSAKERKHILATILGLNQYDLLQQQALDKARALSEEKKALGRIVEQYNTELTKQTTIQEDATNEKKNIEQLSTTITNTEAQQKNVTQAHATGHARLAHLTTTQATYNTKQQAYSDNISKLFAITKAWKLAHVHALTLPPIALLHEQKAKMMLEEQSFVDAQRKSFVVQEKILTTKQLHQQRLTILEKEIEQRIATHRLTIGQQELAYQHHSTLIATLATQIKNLTTKRSHLEKEITEFQKIITQSASFEKEFVQNKKQFEKRRTFYQTLIQRGNWTKNALNDLEHKQKIVHETNNPSCPLCEQLLTIKRKQFLSQQFTHDEQFLRHRLARVTTLLKTLKDLLVEHHKLIEAQTTQSEQLTRTKLQYQEHEKALVSVQTELTLNEQTHAKLVTVGQSMKKSLDKAIQDSDRILKEANAILTCDPELITLAASLTTLNAEIKKLTIDAQAYQKLQQTMSELDQKIKLHAHQIESAQQQQERRIAVRNMIKELKALKLETSGMHAEIQTIPQVAKEQEQLDVALRTLHEQMQQLRITKEQSLQKLGSLEHELLRLQTIGTEVAKKITEAQTYDTEIDDYQQLATAFSKNGIQALLIEQAIPEIEQDANGLLAQLTDNQAQIFIESLRDLKSGGVKETLDIQIADGSGIRPYEMYSGGEAFRVDFALRIAISKLLARRAGTALQTLIIDEGFGSQDEEGLAHIMDALYAIQSDFAKIIVVSHLPELKHNFPVHFVVEKGPSGSMVHIEERG